MDCLKFQGEVRHTRIWEHAVDFISSEVLNFSITMFFQQYKGSTSCFIKKKKEAIVREVGFEVAFSVCNRP